MHDSWTAAGGRDVESLSGCTNGFPVRNRLVGDVIQSSGPVTQLTVIPEMNFTCNGTITGYTFAGRLENGSQFPMIQIWRQKCNRHYRTGANIVMNDVLCKGGFVLVFDGVFRCNLIETAQRAVQPGDVLGLEIAPQSSTVIDLYSVRVIKGPTNYVFIEEQFPSSNSLGVVLWESDSIIQNLPQITIKVSGT